MGQGVGALKEGAGTPLRTMHNNHQVFMVYLIT